MLQINGKYLGYYWSITLYQQNNSREYPKWHQEKNHLLQYPFFKHLVKHLRICYIWNNIARDNSSNLQVLVIQLRLSNHGNQDHVITQSIIDVLESIPKSIKNEQDMEVFKVVNCDIKILTYTYICVIFFSPTGDGPKHNGDCTEQQHHFYL